MIGTSKWEEEWTLPPGGGGGMKKKLYGGIFSMCAECVYILSMWGPFFLMWGVSFSTWGGGGIFRLAPHNNFWGAPPPLAVVTLFTAQTFISSSK